MRLAHSILLLVLFAGMAAANDGAAALQDRLTFPVEVQPYLYYISTATAPSEVERTHQEIAIKLVIPSLSRQVVLERCSPQPVEGQPTLWRLNLADLHWSIDDWRHIISAYPYHPTGSSHPLVIRADWFLLTALDASATDSFYRLLLGAKPKNRAEVLEKLGVTDDPAVQYGLIAAGSPVSKSGIRFIRSLAILRGWSYLTEDSFKIAGNTDPLKFPIGHYPHDGEELLVGSPKMHLATGRRGVMVAGFLFDGKGKTIDKADTALVEDYTKTRGFTHIVAGLSCFSCHQNGPNGPSINVLKTLTESGTEANVYRYADKEAIEAFHYTDFTEQIRRESADYCDLGRLATGVENSDAVEALRSTLSCYDADVTFERASAELYMQTEEFVRAVAWMSDNDYDFGGWVPLMVKDRAQTVPRATFDEHYTALSIGCIAWRGSL